MQNPSGLGLAPLIHQFDMRRVRVARVDAVRQVCLELILFRMQRSLHFFPTRGILGARFSLSIDGSICEAFRDGALTHKDWERNRSGWKSDPGTGQHLRMVGINLDRHSGNRCVETDGRISGDVVKGGEVNRAFLLPQFFGSSRTSRTLPCRSTKSQWLPFTSPPA
jgi:hypothetical protein